MESSTSAALQRCASVILDFLQSKSLFAVERAFRVELELSADQPSKADNNKSIARNLWTSQLEQLLDAVMPLSLPLHTNEAAAEITDLSSEGARPTPLDDSEENFAAGLCGEEATKVLLSKQKRRPKAYELRLDPRRDKEETYRNRRSRDPLSRVVFHDPPSANTPRSNSLVRITLPVLYNPYTNGLEDEPELALDVGSVLIDRYRIVAHIGKGSFSRVVQVR